MPYRNNNGSAGSAVIFSDPEKALEAVRAAQKKSSTSPRGRPAELCDKSIGRIKDTMRNSATIKGLGLDPLLVKTVMERFEAVAHRHRGEIEISDDARPAIYERLATELAGNIQTFHATDLEKEKFISATVLHGDLSRLPDQRIGGRQDGVRYGEFFADSFWAIKRAVMNNSGNPAAKLDEVAAQVTQLEEKFKSRMAEGRLKRDNLVAAVLQHERPGAHVVRLLSSRRHGDRGVNLGRNGSASHSIA